MKHSDIIWTYLGVIPYNEALKLQTALRQRILTNDMTDTLLLLEHPSVFTLGCSAKTKDILISSPIEEGIEVVHTDRGGLVTYHGLGQLVGYPIIDLQRRKLGTRDYVIQIGKVLVETLNDFGIESHWSNEHPGIWIQERKIASVGIHVHRHVSTHGFALNISTDLRPYSMIIPCGLPECEITSMEKELGKIISISELIEKLVPLFGRIFKASMKETTKDSIWDVIKPR